MSDDRLSELEADARALLDAMLDEACARPDRAEFHQRLLQLDGQDRGELPDPSSDTRLASTIELGAPDPRLAEINGDARLLLDAMLDAPRRRPSDRLGRRRTGPRRALALALAAVVLGLAGGALANNWLAARRQAELDRDLAEARALAAARFAADEAAPSEAPSGYPPALAPIRQIPAPPPRPPTAPTAATGPSQVARGPDLATLDAQAYAALQAGRLDEATALFGQIAKRGGRSEYAELAYGELFALARRHGGGDELEKLWRSYLKRFAKGRYADAARAGLCRRAPTDDEAACWADYLHDHPRGFARKEALRATEPE